jgi:hypothetical protein
MIRIRAFINGWNDRCQAFVWSKTSDEILKKATAKGLQLRVHEFGPSQEGRLWLQVDIHSLPLRRG